MSEALDKTSGPRHRKGGAPVWRGDGAGRSQVRYRLSGPPVSSLSSGSGAGISRSSSAEGGSAAHGAPHGGSERAESGRWRRDTPPALPSDHCTSRRSLHESPITAARARSVPAGPQARVCGVLVRVWPAACGCVGVCVCVCMCVSVYVRRTPRCRRGRSRLRWPVLNRPGRCAAAAAQCHVTAVRRVSLAAWPARTAAAGRLTGRCWCRWRTHGHREQPARQLRADRPVCRRCTSPPTRDWRRLGAAAVPGGGGDTASPSPLPWQRT